jgi:Spy/CpxP family protein refolding chaperone
MKKIHLLLTVGALVAFPLLAQAQDNAAPPPPPPDGGPGEHHHHHDPLAGLTDAEKAELKKAHDAAIAADPTLATEEKEADASDDREKKHAFREKLDAAMIKADPAVEPIIAKIKKHHPKPPGGPEGEQPASTPAAPSGT